MKRVMFFLLGMTISLCSVSAAVTMQRQSVLLSRQSYQVQLIQAVESMSILYQGHAVGDFLKAGQYYINQQLASEAAYKPMDKLLENDLLLSDQKLRPPLAWDLISVLPDARLYSFFTSTDLGGYGENDPPYIPSNPYPANNAIDVQLTDLTLTWTGGDPNPEDTVVYDVYFGTDDENPDLIAESIEEAEYEIGNISPDTHYFWKIVARDNWDAETEGPLWNFVTVENHPPYEPVNPLPPNEATDVDLNANLSWECNDPDPGDTLEYDVYFGTTNPPPLVVTGQPHNTYDPGTMISGTLYFWQITARDNWGAETDGPIWSFTTYDGENNPPHVPSDPYPENGAPGIPVDNLTLTWVGGDPDPGNTVVYDLYFGDTASPALLQKDIPDPEYTLAETLQYSTTYYWYIVARDNLFAETAGPLWVFTTEDSLYTPTPEPTEPPTQPPTPTPDPSEPTATPDPSEPTPTPDPSEPTPTPDPSEPTPTPCDKFSVKLDMGGDYFCGGDTVYLTANVCNPDKKQYLPLWVILEVENMLWFYPSWRDDGGIDYNLALLPENLSTFEIIPEFIWPDDIEGSYYGVNFYGALTDTRITEILGDYDVLTFGWGPCL